jgi:hypothetical protein
VEEQEVPEMFCLVTDLIDHEEYPAPELLVFPSFVVT